MTTDLALLVLRSSAVMALALAAVACLSRWSAAMRHRVLALAFCGAVVVGPLVAVVPAWPVLPSPSIALAPAAARVSGRRRLDRRSAAAGRGRRRRAAYRGARRGADRVGAWRRAGPREAGRRFLVRPAAGAASSRSTAGDTWARVLDEVRAGYGIGRAVRLAVTDGRACSPRSAW